MFMFFDVFYNIFWLFTTSDLFVKDAESADDVSKTENTEKTSEVTIATEDYNVAGIVGKSRKYWIFKIPKNMINGKKYPREKMGSPTIPLLQQFSHKNRDLFKLHSQWYT